MMITARRMIGLVLFGAISALPLAAQTTSGSIAGTVVDAQGAAVPGAKVTATSVEKTTSVTATTDNTGRFVFPQLLPGHYTIIVEGSGFKKFEKTDVILNANDNLSVGVLTLQVGTLVQTVEVQAQGIELKTESAERSDALVGQQLQNIAVNGRSYLSLVLLTPGIVSTVNLQTAGHGGVGSISTNGGRFNQNNLTLNGIGNVDTGNNGDQLATISLDAVQEFKILTSNYQAEYGRSSGAQISVETKSGGKDFHGSGYWFHRHDSLNANNWKNNRDGLPRNLFRFNDIGYTLGGPVYIPGRFNKNKDKLFFFWSQEYQRQLRPQGRRDVTVPTALERQGDFSQSVDKNNKPFSLIRDASTGLPCTASDTRGCFKDGGVLGRIPQNRLNPLGVAILKIYPLPNAQSAANKGFNFISQISDNYPRREDLLRLDYNLTDKWKLTGHYVNNNDAVTSAYGSFVLGSNTPLVPITDTRPGRSFAIGALTMINPTMTNEARFGFGHNQINIDPVNDGLTRAKTGLSSLPMLFPGAIQKDFIPNFGFNGTRIDRSPGLGTRNAPFFNYNTTIEWIDNLSKVWNQHTIKTGAYIQRSRKDQTSFASANGDFNFGDSNSNPLDSGFGFANAALGIFTSFNQASKYATGLYRYTNAEFYVQDTWKIHPRLTLDYGMRFNWIQPQFDTALQTSTFLPDRYDPSQAPRLFRPALDSQGNRIAIDPVTGQTLPASAIGKIVPNSGNTLDGIFQAGKGVSKYLMENRGIHLGPRFGLAYDLTGHQNLVLRAGGAILYDRYQGNETFDMITNPPTTVAPTIVNDFIKNIDPNNITPAPVGLNAFSFDGKVPTTYDYSFGIQSKLPYAMVLDVAYVGSLGRHLLQRLNLNPVSYRTTFDPLNQDPTKGTGGTLGTQALDADFLRPRQGFGSITDHQMGGTSNYNALQVSLNRRYAKGLFLGVAYTWSKALTVASGDGSFFRIDSLTRLANYGPADFDRRHTLAINYIYNLPSVTRHFGGADNTVTRLIFNGWQISGVTLIQSGSPYGVSFEIPGTNLNQTITGSYTEGPRVKLLGNPLQGTSDDPYHRLNPAMFTVPAVGSIGIDAPVNYLRRPRTNNWDLSLQKTIPLKAEPGVRLELRVDAFNVFNHTQFSGINSNIKFRSITEPTPMNLVFRPDGTINDINGFGSVSGARDPRILQLVTRIVF